MSSVMCSSVILQPGLTATLSSKLEPVELDADGLITTSSQPSTRFGVATDGGGEPTSIQRLTFFGQSSAGGDSMAQRMLDILHLIQA